MRRFILLLILAIPIGAGFGDMVAVAAPVPRGIVSIDRPVVELKDLFTDPGPQGSMVLGPAPPPGDRIKVGARQLATIARQYGVAWTNVSSGAFVTIERPGRPVTKSAIVKVLRPALADAGAPAHFVIHLADTHFPMIPPDETPRIVVNRVSYRRVDGRFEAHALLNAHGMNPRPIAMVGIVSPSRQAVVALHALNPGEVVGNADVALKWIAQSAFPKGALTDPADAIGMKITRRVASGAPLTHGLVTRLMIVNHGATVDLELEMPNLVVTEQGVALAAGSKGAVIPVLNPSSHEVVQAVIDGPNHAHVLPGSQPSPSRGQIPYYSMMNGRK